MENNKLPEKILIIEDEAIIAIEFQEALFNKGASSVEIAHNYNEALLLIETYNPSIILLDINLGEGSKSGIELAKVINEKFSIPFIYVTSYSVPEIITKVAETNPYGFITKPINYDMLFANIFLAFKKFNLEQELEAEKISKDQIKALTENSPNLILRLSVDGEIGYVNNVMRRVSGKDSEHYDGKTIYNSELLPGLVDFYESAIEKAKIKKRKILEEIYLDTFYGKRFFEIHVIPEKDINKVVHSVLIIKNDITDQKFMLDDVQKKNKSILDSINYSKKIQSTILSDRQHFTQFFSDVFVINRPKDVVSGDFPWFYSKGDYAYLAAVDCTGHGVPGAIMSMISFFLLNKIVENSDEISPSEILDRFHLGLIRTLKQHYKESKLKDGCDIALCRLNVNSKQLDYAGANRPLLNIKSNELEVIKGDRMSIGGFRSKKHPKRFTNNIIDLNQTKFVCIYSDGITDQFGPSELGESKIGGKRIRKELEIVKNDKFDDIVKHINFTLDSWRQDKKQTDDMLMIGFSV